MLFNHFNNINHFNHFSIILNKTRSKVDIKTLSTILRCYFFTLLSTINLFLIFLYDFTSLSNFYLNSLLKSVTSNKIIKAAITAVKNIGIYARCVASSMPFLIACLNVSLEI